VKMPVTFEPLPGDSAHGPDRPEFGLAGSPEMVASTGTARSCTNRRSKHAQGVLAEKSAVILGGSGTRRAYLRVRGHS